MLFFVRSQHALHRIRRAFRGVVIMSNLQLTEQSQRNQLYAGNDQHCGEQHQRAVLAHYVAAMNEFLDHHPQRDAEARGYTRHADRSKEVQGTREICEQEADSQQVEEYAEGAADSVMRDLSLIHI